MGGKNTILNTFPLAETKKSPTSSVEDFINFIL